MNNNYITVTEVNKYIKEVINEDLLLKKVYLKGEISNFKAHSRGHFYFTLKDENSRINAVMFSFNNKNMKFMPYDGMKVLVTGKIDVYEASGSYQIYVEEMLEDGIGALYVAFEQLKKKLSSEGLFDKDKKKNIGSILIFSNIGLIIAPLLVGYITKKLSLITLAVIVIIISIIAIIPLFRLDIKESNIPIKYQKIEKNKLLFFILEQAKVINLSLQPLYLYLFINNKIEYVGIFNAIMGISSCLFIYFFVRKIDDKKYFKYLNMLFCLTLLYILL